MFFSEPKTIDSIISDITVKIEALQDLAIKHKWQAEQKKERIAFVSAEAVESINRLNQQIVDVQNTTDVVVNNLEAEVTSQLEEAQRAQRLAGNFLAMIN